ncbi:hypothetical protein [Flagellimonas sp.]|uniref:hypothetical protein n=1 Tax=Flagellimonas sp. TaxID=2058762 RepID=UPI003BAFA6AB
MNSTESFYKYFKDFKIIIIGIMVIGIFIFYYLPNIISPEKSFTYESGTLREVYTETYKERRRKSYMGYRTKQRLVLVTIDQQEKKYILTSNFKEYWPIFQDSSAINKYMKVRLGKDNSREDPVEIRLDNKTVYGRASWAKNNWIFPASILLVIVLFIQLLASHNDSSKAKQA